MTERGEIRYGDSRIAYQVVRSARRRKTIEVTVDAPGIVTVAAPDDTPPEHIEATVRRRAGWIIKHDGEAASALPPRRFVMRRVLRQADGGRAQTSLSWLADTLLSQHRTARIKFCPPTPRRT